ncbi:conjugal transfer protein TrbG [Caenimonas koreensis DSM 17982]|uniref:Conjugal transfer protein TrbG n=1 Tax=Caenimonas koreensis DSM 17982 TaxID=1121255 RepID=A0A844B8B3_9BURK|nr:TrbG/VirB9 family P-type conjugative transfer protein [Caenimonas koreensis]MRD49392.1 conjugal transfer protein TrbG [Caenimonas koreensis DSM 17982]
MKARLLSLLAIVALSAHADPRIRTEIYDKTQVYNVHTMIGRATLIQLEDDESLAISPASVLGIGDADAWNLGVRGNNIVLKPSQKMPHTNVVLVTNKRTYSFELLATPKEATPTYILRFRYPDSEAAKAAAEAAAEAKRAQITAAAKAEKVVVNADYVWRGDNEMLKPTAAYDDGRSTRLVYDHGGELPVFFKVLPDGSESLLNFNIDPAHKNTVVLHEVIRTVRARMGDSVIEIVNKGYVLPKFNESGTGVPGTVRVDKGSQS